MIEPENLRGVYSTPSVAKKKKRRKRQKIDPALPLCPICQGPLRWITGIHGLFLGCRAFPKCKGKRNKSEAYGMIHPPA